MGRHIGIFLNNYEKEKGEKTYEDLYEHADEELEREAETYFRDIEAEIGMLIC